MLATEPSLNLVAEAASGSEALGKYRESPAQRGFIQLGSEFNVEKD